MGLYCFPGPRAEGMLPVLLINTVVSVVSLKNTLKSLFVLLMGGAAASLSNSEEDSSSSSYETTTSLENSSGRRVSISRYGSLCRNMCSRRCCINARKRDDAASTITSCTTCGGNNDEGWPSMECCVCLCRFEVDEEVSELSCKHFFHKGCLEKWFMNQHTTCPLCRSVI